MDTSISPLARKVPSREQLFSDQEIHHHRTIWSKEAHGGPYIKVACKTNHDGRALHQAMVLGSSTAVARVEDMWGYETVSIGRTTNIVGNHMTQGAIDLIEAEMKGMDDHDTESEAVIAKRLQRRCQNFPLRQRGPEAIQPMHQGGPCSDVVQIHLATANKHPDVTALRLMARQLMKDIEAQGTNHCHCITPASSPKTD